MTSPAVRDAAWLVKNGVPFDEAFTMPRSLRAGLAIIFSELESGRRFNFSTWDFDPLPKS